MDVDSTVSNTGMLLPILRWALVRRRHLMSSSMRIVHYTARFADGIVFDSSYERGRPLSMHIGVGGKRKLQSPPHLGCRPEPAGCFVGLVRIFALPLNQGKVEEESEKR